MISKIRSCLRHLFIPHHTNNFRAKTVHHASIGFYILALLIFQSFYSLSRSWNRNVLGFATDITIEKVLELVNLEREKSDLEPLSLSAELSQAAVNKASDMFEKDYWAHVSPTGITPWKFITDAGYRYNYAGENLAKGFDNAEEVVKALMASPTHKANILKSEYANIGLAVVNGRLNGQETTLVVQEFGSKQGRQIEVKTDNKITVAGQERSSIGFASSAFEIENKIKLPFSGLNLPKSISVILCEFLLLVLLLDGIYIFRKQEVRLHGESFAHAIFFFSLLLAMGAAGVGVIL